MLDEKQRKLVRDRLQGQVGSVMKMVEAGAMESTKEHVMKKASLVLAEIRDDLDPDAVPTELFEEPRFSTSREDLSCEEWPILSRFP